MDKKMKSLDAKCIDKTFVVGHHQLEDKNGTDCSVIMCSLHVS